jgi:DNA polymerase-3 subunit beta
MSIHNPTGAATVSNKTNVGNSQLRFKTLKGDLFSGVQTVQTAVSTRVTLPILSNILVEADPDGVTLAATDLEVGIKTRIKADVESSGAATIPAKLFSDFLRTLDEKREVSVSVSEGVRVEIKSGRDRCHLTGLPKEDYPVLPHFEFSDAVPIDRATLRDMIRKTVFAASTDETRYVLNGVNFVLGNDALTLVATDGRRLSLFKQKGISSPSSINAIVPTKALHELLRVIGTDDAGRRGQSIRMAFGDNQVSFKDGETVVLSRLVEGHFPSYEQVIPRANPISLTLDRPAFQAAVTRASIGALERGGSVHLNLSPGNMRISASSQGRVEVDAELAVSYEGSPLTIAFNPVYILDLLKVLDVGEIFFDLGTPLNPGAIRIPGSENYVYVLMPMKV